MAHIALLTDFGNKDHYVAAMKGVILQVNPRAMVVDVCHEIQPQDIFHGAFVLRQVLPYYPADTIFAAVVDPTVGTRRRILAARYSERIVIAPDNGLLSLLQRDADLQEIRVVENRRFFTNSLSSTFHGRDIIAPVAAHLSRGARLDQLGPAADQIDMLALPSPKVDEVGSVTGEVILIDHFGNLITNISEIDLSLLLSSRRSYTIKLAGREIGPIHFTYSDVEPGEPVALIGSSQMLEIAVRNGHASDSLRLKKGEAVHIG